MTQQTFVFANAPATHIPSLEGTFRDALATHDGHHVASIADVVILRLARATDAIAICLNTISALGASGPGPRFGVDTGIALRDGERWGGPVVELAALLAEHAGPGQVLTTSATRQATDRAQIDFVDLGKHRLHGNAPPTALYRAYRVTDTDRSQPTLPGSPEHRGVFGADTAPETPNR